MPPGLAEQLCAAVLPELADPRDGTVAFDAVGKILKQLDPMVFDDSALQTLRQKANLDSQGRVHCESFFSWLCESDTSCLKDPPAPPSLFRQKSCLDRLFDIRDDNAQLEYDVVDGVAVISLGSQGLEEKLPWGTCAAEHRLYPAVVKALLAALDSAEEDEAVQAVVVTASGKYWSNGFDLKWIQANPEHADTLQQTTELLCARLLKYPKPTVAACNGHATAAGAMLLLSFDVKVMNSEKGFCFVPGIDLGLVYSPGMSALMAAKLPLSLRHDFIVFGNRQTAVTLLQHGVINDAVPGGEVLEKSIERAKALRAKSKHEETMARIKETLYHEAIAALECEPDELVMRPNFVPMGFSAVPSGTDRPSSSAAMASRKAESCARAQAQVQTDLLRLSAAPR